jgi:hypothetical protein
MFGRDMDATRAAQGRRRKARAKPGAAKRKSETLPDLRKLGVRRIPWDDLTPEEQRGIEELKQADERWHRQRAEVRKRRWPWLDIDHAAAGRVLDRAAALEKRGPLPEKQHPERKRPQKRQGQPQKPKKVSEAALRNCLLAIVAEHAKLPPNSLPPDEETLHADLERRLGAQLERDRVRRVRNEHAPQFKRRVGRPRKDAQ